MGGYRRFTQCNFADSCKEHPSNFLLVGHDSYELMVCDKHLTIVEKRCAKHEIPIGMSFKTDGTAKENKELEFCDHSFDFVRQSKSSIANKLFYKCGKCGKKKWFYAQAGGKLI